MDSAKGRKRKGAISKMWERCKSFKKVGGMKSLALNLEVAPVGCFPICVGPEKERFVIKTEHVNHRLFKILLEEAESEYGYCHKGILMLPCEVDHFVDVLMEMEMDYYFDQQQIGCNFAARNSSSYHFLTPQRVLAA
ncbi:auxin-responsive protein SAUR50-like [Salvia divinorum]|uniref:Auxin-responsive protein SAUR50-like n=1 Tax=Salvia divinorum TaxID=28513 RepID=A0ABD1H2Q1_SALDI